MKMAGFSLIEMMVALTISVLLSTLLFNHYVDAAGALSLQSSMYHLQEIANVSTDMITHEIQQAGYIGCAKLSRGFPIKGYENYILTSSNALQVSETSIISRHASVVGAQLIAFSADKKILYVSDNLNFKPDDILIISDCRHAEIFKVKKLLHLHQQLKLEMATPLSSDYDVSAEIAFFEINRLFIKKTSKHKNALYLEDIKSAHRQIVDGVEALQFSAKSKGVSFSQTIRVNALQKEWGGYVSITS